MAWIWDRGDTPAGVAPFAAGPTRREFFFLSRELLSMGANLFASNIQQADVLSIILIIWPRGDNDVGQTDSQYILLVS